MTRRLGGVKSSRGKRTNAYHVVAPVRRGYEAEWLNPELYGGAIVRNFEKGLSARSYRFSMVFFDPESKLDTFKRLVADTDFCDGILLLSKVVDEPLARLLLENEYPHVSIDYRAERFGVNTVDTHKLNGYRLGVEYLASLGHRKIGFVGPKDNNHYSLFLAAMVEHQLDVSENLSCFFDTPRDATENSEAWTAVSQENFSRFLDQSRRITAVFCHNDMTALGVVNAMKPRGVTPGEDISVLGFDNIEQRGRNPVKSPILTTIDNPRGEVGVRGAELLLNQIMHRQRGIVHEYVPVSLIKRQTTGKVPDNK